MYPAAINRISMTATLFKNEEYKNCRARKVKIKIKKAGVIKAAAKIDTQARTAAIMIASQTGISPWAIGLNLLNG